MLESVPLLTFDGKGGSDDDKDEGPKRLLERNCCTNLIVVALVSSIWIAISLYASYYMGNITNPGYLYTGWGASEEDLYPYTADARLDHAEMCLLERDRRHANLRDMLDRINLTDTKGAMAAHQRVMKHFAEPVDACIPPPPLGTPPPVVTFLGVYISSKEQFIALHAMTFIDTIVSAYSYNTAGLYFSNIVQDSEAVEIAFGYWTVQLSRAFLNVCWTTSAVFGSQASYTQWTYLVNVMVGNILFYAFLTHHFLAEKETRRAEEARKAAMEQSAKVDQLEQLVDQLAENLPELMRRNPDLFPDSSSLHNLKPTFRSRARRKAPVQSILSSQARRGVV